MSTEIQIKPEVDDVFIVVSPELINARDTLIGRARAGSKIVSQSGADKVAIILKDLNSFARNVEAAASEASRPVRALLDQINGTKKELTDDILIEKDRLGTLSARWRQEIEAKAAEEARARAEELLKLKREQEEIDRKRREEAELRNQETAHESEALGVDVSSGNISLEDLKGNRDDYQQDNAPHEDAEFDKIEEAEQARLDRMKELQEEELRQKAALARSIPSGMHVRKAVEVEVYDIEALYNSNPACVELKPRLAVIKGLAKSLKAGEEIPGVRFTEVAKTVVRS